MLTDFSNAYIFIDVRGIGAVGSALHSHCRGREFESHMLQEPKSVDFTALSGFFHFRKQKETGRIFPVLK